MSRKKVVIFMFVFAAGSLIVAKSSILKANRMEPVNLEYIKQIESSGDPNAFNEGSQARGLYQITPILLREWNSLNPKEQYQKDDLFKPEVNKKIATWYLNDRIPEMLAAFKKPITLENVLTSYNAGIGYVAHDKPIPSETKDYISKYKQMDLNKNSNIVKEALAIARGKHAK